MYEAFYGLRERPFDLAVNPRFLYLTAQHREALGNLYYGITAKKGITLLIGEAGTGKTTLVRAALESQKNRDACIVCVTNPTLTRNEFFEFLAHRFELPDDAASSKTRFLFHLERTLLERHERNAVVALVIDEAQSLPHELLEEVRLLANLETSTEKLLPVVLAGQPEVADRLNAPELRQLKQRVALRCVLTPLDRQDTAAYIARRIQIAGGNPAQVFTRGAVEAIFSRSGGIPRTISVICDNALVTGFAKDEGERPVSEATVLEVCHDFDLVPFDSTAAPRRHSRGPHAAPGTAPAAVKSEKPLGPHSSEERTESDYFTLYTRPKRFSFF
jgi:type II secretory pathway predicted ATPase ExeA